MLPDFQRQAVKTFIGTSGFSYKEWRGHFYPEGLKPADYLAYYSQKLGSVEINNTFYRLPRQTMLESWAERTPASFRFAIKASRRITHIKKLRDTRELLEVLGGALEVLGPRLGPVLFQTPPTLRADLGLLRDFLDDVAEELAPASGRTKVVFEVRHPSWCSDEVKTLLRERSVALCGSDGDDEGRVPVELEKTASFAYLRLRKESYSEPELASWAELLRTLGCEEAFVYFKHETTGPALALRLGELLC
jgi:uncharacterized protein YecE (DUF72 family)